MLNLAAARDVPLKRIAFTVRHRVTATGRTDGPNVKTPSNERAKSPRAQNTPRPSACRLCFGRKLSPGTRLHKHVVAQSVVGFVYSAVSHYLDSTLMRPRVFQSVSSANTVITLFSPSIIQNGFGFRRLILKNRT